MRTSVHSLTTGGDDRRSAPGPQHLQPTAFIDCEHPVVREFAEQALDGAVSDRDRVRRLFVASRDELLYDPYAIDTDPTSYAASEVIKGGRGFCIGKAVVLTAVARAAGIPARLGFADVRNHLQSPKLAEAMGGSDLFVFHGYSELHVDGQWRKATPAFNATLCARAGVPPLEFDGTADAMLHRFAGDGAAYMEYVSDRGAYDDLPLEEILSTLIEAYPGMMERIASARAAAVEDALFAEPAGRGTAS